VVDFGDATGSLKSTVCCYQTSGWRFRFVDDIWDITATQEELGKTVGKDLQAKSTILKSVGGWKNLRKGATKTKDSFCRVVTQ